MQSSDKAKRQIPEIGYEHPIEDFEFSQYGRGDGPPGARLIALLFLGAVGSLAAMIAWLILGGALGLLLSWAGWISDLISQVRP